MRLRLKIFGSHNLLAFKRAKSKSIYVEDRLDKGRCGQGLWIDCDNDGGSIEEVEGHRIAGDKINGDQVIKCGDKKYFGF